MELRPSSIKIQMREMFFKYLDQKSTKRAVQEFLSFLWWHILRMIFRYVLFKVVNFEKIEKKLVAIIVHVPF